MTTWMASWKVFGTFDQGILHLLSWIVSVVVIQAGSTPPQQWLRQAYSIIKSLFRVCVSTKRMFETLQYSSKRLIISSSLDGRNCRSFGRQWGWLFLHILNQVMACWRFSGEPSFPYLWWKFAHRKDGFSEGSDHSASWLSGWMDSPSPIRMKLVLKFKPSV